MKQSFILPTLTLALMSVFSVGYASTDNALYQNAAAAGLNSKILTEAIHGYQWAKAHGEVHNPNVLTVVDFAKPSKEKRLWVLNLKTDKVMMHTYVANGANSGRYVSTRFSNAFNSHESSLGVYTTALSPFYGKHGRALKVHGLEPGINSNAYKRAIEIHGTSYVSPYVAKTYHRVGGSWGCFAVDHTKVEQLVNYTEGGSVLFAYAPQEANDSILDT